MTPLRRRMIEDMRIRKLSPHTQRAYVEQVSRFARHFGRPPELLGQDEIRSWQIYLVEERRLAASSISVAVAALRFVYAVTLKKPWIVEDDIPTSRQPKKLPVVPSPEEVARFLAAVGTACRSSSTGWRLWLKSHTDRSCGERRCGRPPRRAGRGRGSSGSCHAPAGVRSARHSRARAIVVRWAARSAVSAQPSPHLRFASICVKFASIPDWTGEARQFRSRQFPPLRGELARNWRTGQSRPIRASICVKSRVNSFHVGRFESST